MKKSLLSLALLAVLALPVAAQTTNTPPILWPPNLSLTNFAVAPFIDYAPQAPSKVGGGIAGVWNASQNVGVMAAVEYIGSQFIGFNGQLQLKLPLRPFAFAGNNWLGNMVMTPFADGGVGTSLSGGGGDNGTVIGIVGAGDTFDIAKVLGGTFSVGFAYQYWSGGGAYAGNHYQGFAALRWGF